MFYLYYKKNTLILLIKYIWHIKLEKPQVQLGLSNTFFLSVNFIYIYIYIYIFKIISLQVFHFILFLLNGNLATDLSHLQLE